MNDLRLEAINKAQAPYTMITFRDKVDENEYVYIAINPELDGCIAQGETIEDAQKNLNEVRIDYIEHLLKHNLNIPLPQISASRTAGESVTSEKMEIHSFEDTTVYGDKLFKVSPILPG